MKESLNEKSVLPVVRKRGDTMLNHIRSLGFIFIWGGLVLLATIANSATSNVEIKTSEATRPDVAVSPNGDFLVFTLLGHLFQMPVEGGKSKQLTFGPYFDSDPAISPDGMKVVFSSDRDGVSDGNLFLLNLSNGELSQLTEERWAARPVWSPDGKNIAYLSYEPIGFFAQYEYVGELAVRIREKIKILEMTKNV